MVAVEFDRLVLGQHIDDEPECLVAFAACAAEVAAPLLFVREFEPAHEVAPVAAACEYESLILCGFEF